MKKLKLTLLVLGVLLVWTVFIGMGFVNGYLLRALSSSDKPQSFVDAAVKQIEKEFEGSLALTLIEDGQVKSDYFHAKDDEIDEYSVFIVASVSKWITSWGIFRLVEAGRLDLDAPIDDYLSRWHLPESEYDHNDVTIRRLLSHSSGLVDDLGYEGFEIEEEVQTIEASLIKAADSPYSEGIARIGYTPGSKYMYSGAGYTILQLIIEEVSGMSFSQYMAEKIFAPLGMEHSTFDPSEAANLEFATFYNREGHPMTPNRFTALAAASLYTCSSDLSKFMLAHISDNDVLSQATIAEMIKPQTYIGETPVYASGPHLYSQNYKDSNVIGHDGNGGKTVINTAARIDLKSKNGIIILESGHHNIASVLADEWMYSKFGIADFVVMQRNIPYLLMLLLVGYIAIIILSILYFRKMKKLGL